MVSAAGAVSITVAKTDLDHFIGTYDAEANTFIDYYIAAWDTAEAISYFNAINELPDQTGVYYGLAPWYTNLAEAVRPFPELGIVLVAFVDVKLSYSASAIVTKWRDSGDSLVFICITRNFPDLGGAPNLDRCFLLPDSSYFLVTRSAGGDMQSIWHRYAFLVESPDCVWTEIYGLESVHLMFETEYVERLPKLIDSLAPVYYLQVINRHYESDGDKKPDGSYVHEVAGADTIVVNLWDMAKKALGR